MVVFNSTSHAEITTDDGKKIALYADGVARFTEAV
jgi:flagellar biosynthesis/type III secretory pathway ATPase